MADYGIKISTAGNEVATAADRYLSLSSKQNIFKIAAAGSSTVNASSVLTIAHNLGYKPNFLAYIETGGVANQMQLISASLITNSAQTYADATNLYINNTDAVNNRDIYYYIMHDPI